MIWVMDWLIKNEITNREWRTPPLWGIGLAKTVNANATFLHDGRATSLLEAVLWHSGEAKNSLDYLYTNHELEIKYLIKFLESL